MVELGPLKTKVVGSSPTGVTTVAAKIGCVHMINSVLTVVAYKPNGVTTRRCCVVDSWDSQLETLVTQNPEEAIQWMANLKIQDHEGDQGQYEFTVLVDGVDSNWEGLHDDESVWEQRHLLRSQVEGAAEKIYRDYVADAKARAEKAKQKKLADAARDRRRAKQRELDALEAAVSNEALAATVARIAALREELASSG